jgi:hypothetical protein
MKEYRAWWLAYVQKMDDTRILKQAFCYTQRGRSNIGHLRKGWEAEPRRGRFLCLEMKMRMRMMIMMMACKIHLWRHYSFYAN